MITIFTLPSSLFIANHLLAKAERLLVSTCARLLIVNGVNSHYSNGFFRILVTSLHLPVHFTHFFLAGSVDFKHFYKYAN